MLDASGSTGKFSLDLTDSSNLKDLPGLFERQQKASAKLETAQVKLIKFAAKYRHKRASKIESLEHKHKPIPDNLAKPINADMLAPYKSTNPSASPGDDSPRDSEEGAPQFLSPEDLGRADQLVPRNKRPTMRLKPHWAPFGLGWLGIGKKVDTIDWARSEIGETAAALHSGRAQLRQDITSVGTEDDFYPPLNSAFIYFNQQIAAHMAEQILLHHRPYRMSSAYIEQSPENVIWFNLNLGAYQLSVRRAVSVAITAGIIAVWTIPVAFIASLANVASLIREFPWMGWLAGNSGGKRLLQGVVTGILPPVLLALINMFLPSVLRCRSLLPRRDLQLIDSGDHLPRDADQKGCRAGSDDAVLCVLGHRKFSPHCKSGVSDRVGAMGRIASILCRPSDIAAPEPSVSPLTCSTHSSLLPSLAVSFNPSLTLSTTPLLSPSFCPTTCRERLLSTSP